MNRRALFLFALLLPLSACTLSLGGGDYGYYGHPHHVPPPYGDWRWDDDLDVYVSIGYPRLYYRDRIYYRWDDHGWYWGDHHGGPWQPQGHRSMPPGLYREHPHPGSKGGQGGSGRHDSGPGQEQWRAPQGQQGQQGQQKNQGQQRQQGQSRYQSHPGGSKAGPPASAQGGQGGQGKQGHGQSTGKGQSQNQNRRGQSQG
jgi:hypothetical protein